MYLYRILFVAILLLLSTGQINADEKIVFPPTQLEEGESLRLVKTIRGNIRPKSIVHSGKGRFFAQNMMYRHSVTVYDRNYTLLKTIKDEISPRSMGELTLPKSLKGSPVEVAFNSTGTYAYVSNYKMYGAGFNNPGQDNCTTSKQYDKSFVYKINTYSLEIESIIEVGSVPKYLAVSPNDKTLLVSNWCSGDMSVIDLETEEEVRRIEIGKYPRGIAIDSRSSFAYISIMGDDQIAVLNLLDYSMSWMSSFGITPRHLVLDPSDRYLYISLSREGEVAKVDLVKRELVKKIETGAEARSIVLGSDARFLYVVNYEDNSISKIDAEEMVILESIDTHEKPIGITFDMETNLIWVACYTGSIQVFEDLDYEPNSIHKDLNITISATDNAPSTRPNSASRKNTAFYYVPRPATQKDPEYYVYREKIEEKISPAKKKVKKKIPDIDTPPKKQLASKESPKGLLDQSIASANINKRVRAASVYHVIVGSYQNDKFAQEKAQELRKKGYETQVLPNEQGGFRVSAGQYALKNAAATAAEQFRKKIGIKAWVLKE